MKLVSLDIKRFKRLQDVRIEFGSGETCITGHNEKGKSTLYDAFCWLVDGKNSVGDKKFDIKDTRIESHVGVVYGAQMVVEVDDETHTLRKQYQEKWVSKRNEPDKVLDGHTTDYFMSGDKVSAGEYNTAIVSVFGADPRILFDVNYFSQLPDTVKLSGWMRRRKMLVDICDAAEPALPEGVNTVDIDATIKNLKFKLGYINHEVATIPIRIDEAKKSIVDIGYSKEGLKNAIDRAESTWTNDLKKLEACPGDLADRRRLNVENQIMQIEDKHNRLANESANKSGDMIRKSKDSLFLAESILKQKQDLYDKTRIDIDESKGRLAGLEKEYLQQVSETFQSSGLCRLCGQDLPHGITDELRQNFNESRANAIGEIVLNGKKEKANLLQLEQLSSETCVKISDARAKSVAIKSIIEQQELAASSAADKFKKGPDISRLTRELESIANAEPSAEREKLVKRVNDSRVALDELMPLEVKQASNDGIDRTVDGYQEELKATRKKWEAVNKKLIAAEEWDSKRCELVEAAVNGMFKDVTFKLFEKLINGGVRKICTAWYKGVPYQAVNSAGKVAMGVEIIKVLQAHHDVKLPIWVDGRESITDDLPEFDGQYVSLRAVKDSELCVERSDGIVFPLL